VTVIQLVVCHSCGGGVHANHHLAVCSMCSNEREFCCECCEAEDTSCRLEYEHDFEPAEKSS
jgi:hypothetical protein